MMTASFGTLVAPWLIQVLGGEQYQPAISVFRLMLWLLVLYAFSQAHRPLFYALRQQKWLFATYVLSTITYALMLFGGIAIGGATGAVGVLLVHGVLFATLRWLIVRRLDASLWIPPSSVLKLDNFDRRLWDRMIHYIRQRP
jgi:O-antigen/teichoic acid export membrane protein